MNPVIWKPRGYTAVWYRPRFPQRPQFGTTALLVTVYGRALPPVRWKLSFTVPCLEGNAVRETSQTVDDEQGF